MPVQEISPLHATYTSGLASIICFWIMLLVTSLLLPPMLVAWVCILLGVITAVTTLGMLTGASLLKRAQIGWNEETSRFARY